MNPAEFFEIPVFKRSELNKHFLQLDRYLKKCVLLAWKHTKFVEMESLNFYMELMSGRARFKNYYAKKNTSRVNMASRMEHGYTTDDRKFLIDNYKIVYAFDNEVSPESLDFNRLVWHTIMEKFFLISKDYCLCCEKVAAGDFSYLKQKMEIEEQLQVKTDYLYGVLKQIHYLYEKFIERRNTIVNPYFRYVYSLATRNSYSDDQTAENFQAGVFGLLRAVLMYNNKQEASTFGNYAQFWIRQAMTDNVYKSFLINIPNCSWTYFNKLEKLRDKTKSLDELAEKANMSVKYVKDVYARILTSQVVTLESQDLDAKDFIYDPTQPDDAHFDEEMLHLLNDDEKFLFAIMFGKYDLLPQKEIDQNLISEEKNRQLSKSA